MTVSQREREEQVQRPSLLEKQREATGSEYPEQGEGQWEHSRAGRTQTNHWGFIGQGEGVFIFTTLGRLWIKLNKEGIWSGISIKRPFSLQWRMHRGGRSWSRDSSWDSLEASRGDRMWSGRVCWSRHFEVATDKTCLVWKGRKGSKMIVSPVVGSLLFRCRGLRDNSLRQEMEKELSAFASVVEMLSRHQSMWA